MAFPANIDQSSLDGITDSRLNGASGFRLAGVAAMTCAFGGALALLASFIAFIA